MKLFHFKNTEKKTLFSPEWNYFIFEDYISESFKKLNSICDNLKEEILNKEKKIIESTEYSDDWGTGLGENSLTSRSDSYNLLNWESGKELKNCIKIAHDNFLNAINLENSEQLYAQCWANVMRKGDRIFPHKHWISEYAYVGGNIVVSASKTKTYYTNPISEFIHSSNNDIGKITLFPNWLEHYTDEVEDDQIRITVAFDIITETVFNEDIFDKKKSHWNKL